jgi:hypothetical protein
MVLSGWKKDKPQTLAQADATPRRVNTNDLQSHRPASHKMTTPPGDNGRWLVPPASVRYSARKKNDAGMHLV